MQFYDHIIAACRQLADTFLNYGKILYVCDFPVMINVRYAKTIKGRKKRDAWETLRKEVVSQRLCNQPE